jgi:hypothetical protein
MISVLNTYSPAFRFLGIVMFQLLSSSNNLSVAQSPSSILSSIHPNSAIFTNLSAVGSTVLHDPLQGAM